MAIPIILRGDTARQITIALAEGYDYEGATLAVCYQGATRTFRNLAAGGSVVLSFSAEETGRFNLGTFPVALVLRLSDGAVRTMSADDAKIKVTDAPGEVYSAVIALNPAETMDALTDADGLGAVKEAVNRLAKIVCAASCLVLCVGATTLNNMPGTNEVYTAAETDARIADAPFVRRNAGPYVVQEIGGTLAPTNGVLLPLGWGWLVALTPTGQRQALAEYIARNQWGFYRGDLAPATNHTCAALGAFAATGTVARARSYGTPTRWTDATGCVWEVGRHVGEWSVTHTGGVPDEDLSWSGPDWYTEADDYDITDVPGWYVSSATMTYMLVSKDPDLAAYSTQWEYYDGEDVVPVTTTCVRPIWYTTNLVGRVALTNDLPDTASIANDLADLRTESALVYRLYSGSNVVAEVTNYNSQVHAPSLRLLQLNESNEYITVWTESNGLARTLARANGYTDAAITNAAPRAWSRTTSGLGSEAPSNTTWISTPTTVIAGGFEYAKVVDTYGEVWVLASNGMAAEFNPDTNAYFRISADDGTPIFSVEKSDAQIVGANASGITVGESSITIPVPVVSSAAPTMYWRYELDSGDWADETTLPSNMGVMWEGSAGTWQCNVTFDGTRPPSMFFKFNFLQEGGVVIRNNATTDLSSGIWVNGVKFVPSVSGNNLIWTKQ